MRLGLEAGDPTPELAAELAITGVPIDGGALVEHGVQAALAPLRKHSLSVCQIGAFGFNPVSDDAEAAQAQTQLLNQIIPLAADTGCRYITLGPGNHHPSGFGHYDLRNTTDDAIHAYAQAIKPLAELAEKHDAVLCIEAYLKGVVRSAESFLAVQDQVGSDRLRCNVDPSSLYAGLHDFLTPMPLVEKTIAGLAGHVGLVHVKELGVEEGFHLQMGLTPITAGHTDWGRFLTLVEPHLPEDSWVILEHILSADQARSSHRYLSDAAHRAGVSLA
ncbi:MAG: TIM barrel protein [Planctomycetota bacterium]